MILMMTVLGLKLQILSLGQPNILEVCEQNLMINEQPFPLITRVDLAQHEKFFHGNNDAEFFQLLMPSTIVQIM
jgi:hypothetical protein